MAMKMGKTGKQRSNTAAKKRFQKTGSGKWKRTKAGVRHLLLQKSTTQKKLGRKGLIMAKGDAQNAARLLPSL
jgi:large subunit ribosomal protein L35